MTPLPPGELSCRNIDFSKSMKHGADTGNVQDMHLYAQHCLRQYSIKGDIDSRKEAEYWLIKAAETDLYHAQLDLAMAYWFKFDQVRNSKEGDYLISQHILSISEGKNHDEFDIKAVLSKIPARKDMTDYEKAFYWFLKTEDHGDCFASMCIGWFYETGAGGVEKDEDSAFSWYLKSAEEGYLPAQSIIGLWYSSGRLKKEIPDAETWYKNIEKHSPYSTTLPEPLKELYGEELERISRPAGDVA